jgi:hypothetical protein
MQTSSVRYTIPTDEAHPRVLDLDLARNGTLVLSYEGKPPLAWASLESPALHSIPIGGRNYYVKLAGGTVAFARGHEYAGDVPRAEVGVTDLSGNARLLARGADSGGFDGKFDFDGTRVAWYAYACRGARMHVQPIDSKVVEESLVRCPLRLRKPPQVKDGKYVVLRFRCHGYATTCRARNVRLTNRVEDHNVLLGEGLKGSRVSLTDKGRQLLRERDALTVRTAATIEDQAGTRERRHGSAVLRK